MKTLRKHLGLAAAVMLGMIAAAAMGAGINGIFTSVNAVSGYEVNGAAGSSGQCLTSNGTFYATAFSCIAAPAFTGASGYQLLPSGLILEWGNAAGLNDNAASVVTLPFTFPHACFNAVATEDEGSVAGRPGNPRTVAAACTSTSTITLWASGTGASGQWIATGY